MSWFYYLKESELTSSTSINENYTYPLCKRSLGVLNPDIDIDKDSWLFCDISNININKYKNSSLQLETDTSSYIVVYEINNTFIPVKCVIYLNAIYFQTAENHRANEFTNGEYSIYYNSKNIRKIHEIQNGTKNDFKVSLSSQLNPYHVSYVDVDPYSYTVEVGSNKNYNFSFINSATDWLNGFTDTVSAKVTLKITGPNFILRGNKGPNFGKLKAIFSPQTKTKPNMFSAQKWDGFEEVIDCYSETAQQNVILYQKNDLEYLTYTIELENLSEKNISSLGNSIKINSYSFLYNINASMQEEQINTTIHSYNQIRVIR